VTQRADEGGHTDNNPVVIFENRHTYTIKEEVPDEEYLVPIGKADIKRKGRDITIIATGFMVQHALDAAKVLMRESIDVEIVDPHTLSPLDMPPLVRSARKTGRVLIVHDAWRNGGIGAEIAASLYEELHGAGPSSAWRTLTCRIRSVRPSRRWFGRTSTKSFRPCAT
jgi:pyruvate/2-oxoglutarate/acetoin dehydrogenase E1 component